MTAPRGVWFKASASGGQNGNCVEVKITEDAVYVRDTKQNGEGPVLQYTHREWASLLDGVRSGEFDLT